MRKQTYLFGKTPERGNSDVLKIAKKIEVLNMKKAMIVIALILLSAGIAWMIDEKPFSKAKEEDIRVLSAIEVKWSQVAKVRNDHDLNSEESGALFFATAINEIYPYLRSSKDYADSFKFLQGVKENPEKYKFHILTESGYGIIDSFNGKRSMSIYAAYNSARYGLFESNQKGYYMSALELPEGIISVSPDKIAKLIQQ